MNGADWLHAPLAQMTGLLLLSVLLGGLVGWDRERHESPAGLRTHILVCVGATLITLISGSVANSGGRIAAQIVTGVGFLGAGTIIREGATGAVRGLTTAASLWATAGIGIAVGTGGLYAELAAVATLIVLGTLTLLNRLENYLNRHRRRQTLTVTFTPSLNPLPALSRLLTAFHDLGVRVRDLRLEKRGDAETALFLLSLPRHARRDRVETALTGNPEILHSSWDDEES